MSVLILYTTEDGRSQIKLRADQQTFRLTQQGMAELFDATKQTVSLHLKNIFQDWELDPAVVAKEFLTTAADGNNERQLSFLYTLCRDSPSPIRVRNCQEMLDGSNTKAVIGKRRACRRFAARRVANLSVARLLCELPESERTAFRIELDARPPSDANR